MRTRHKQRRQKPAASHHWLQWILLLAAGLLVYGRTFHYGFVFDDHEFIVNNPYIRSFGAVAGIWHILPKTRLIGIYSFALNYYFGRLDPVGYHIFNFIVHLLATGLVWATTGVLLKITSVGGKDKQDGIIRQMPFAVAMLFLVHPCQTQAVTYISQRFESMAALFYFGAVYCYLQARISPTGKRRNFLFVVCAVAALLGVMTKETAVTIPLMLLAVEWILFQRLSLVLAGGCVLLGLVLMMLVHADLGIFAQTIPSESHQGDIITFGNYELTQMRVLLTFGRLLILPVGQNVDYDFPLSTGLTLPPSTLVGMGLMVLMIVGVFKLRKNFALISFGLAWMLVTFSINMVPRANVIWEHKLYLISFGFLLALAQALSAFVRDRRALVWLWAGAVTMLSITCFSRNQVWENGRTLWEDGVKKSPRKPRVYANLGLAYSRDQMYGRAVDFLSQAITMDPGDYKNYMNRADAYYQLHEDPHAMDDLNRAIELDHLNFGLYIKRARVYKRLYNDGAAFADLGRSIDLRPNAQAFIERGVLWMAHGQADKALDDEQQALKLEPENYDAVVDRAGVYFCMGRYELALRDLDRAQAMNALDPKIYKNKAFCLMAMGRKQEASQEMDMYRQLSGQGY